MSSKSWLAVPWLAIAFAGCGDGSRPAVFGDTQGSPDAAARVDGEPSLVGTGEPVEKNCGVGPDGGVCACADEPLLGDPPTLYFLLDRSGSMNDSNKWVTVQLTLEQLMIDLGPRAKVGAAVFPDPSLDNCAPGVQVFAPARGDAPAGTAGPTDTDFLVLLGAISANGGTPTAATLQSLAPAIEAIPGKRYVILATDGGPNCNASATCTSDLCTYNIESDPGCDPGGATNCCDPSVGGASAPLACLDADPTIAGVTALAEAGVPVYVVGVPGSAPYAELLDDLAIAGGTARGSEPQYYAVDTTDQAALTSAISKIAAQIAGTCSLPLNQAPADPALLNVFLDGKVLPQAGANGWTLSGSTVTILGASCQEIMTGGVLDVRVEAGCPTVTQ